VTVNALGVRNFQTATQVGSGSIGANSIVGSSLFNSEQAFIVGSAPTGVLMNASVIAGIVSSPQVVLPATGTVGIHNSPPYNPGGFTNVPSPTATPWTATNTTGYDVVVYAADLSTTGIISDITVGGADTGLSTTGAGPAVYPILVPAGTTIGITFSAGFTSSAVSWTWIEN